MSNISNEIRATNVPCSTLSAEATKIYRAKIEEYCGFSHWPIWDYLKNSFSLRDPNGWLLMKEFLGSEPALLFFNPQDESEIFRFEQSCDIVDVIADSTGFEYYVADENLSYLLCFNDHDVLIATGTAKAWLENRKLTLTNSI